MNSSQIKKLLAIKHSGVVGIEECPMGQGSGYFDFWAMDKSWAHPLITGYEIKVSRGDFIGDNKFPKYLKFCNQFYFVCPWGMIKESEVPQDCGLMYVARTGTKLIKKVKAPYRQVDEAKLNRLFKAVLMNRVKIVSSTYHSYQSISRQQMIEEFINQKEENRYYGKGLSLKLSKLYRDKIVNVEKEIEKVKEENKRLQDVKDFCKEIGFGVDQWTSFRIKERLKSHIHNQSAGGVARRLMNNIGESIEKLQMAEKMAQKAHDVVTYAMEKLDHLDALEEFEEKDEKNEK
jgi:hypothetical protein